MPADDPSGARPGPVVLRIKLRYADLDTMVQRFAVNVGRSGLFLPTKSIQPVGTELKFELRIADDTAVLVGLGRVKSSRAPDPANPRAAFGMAVELMRVTREGREVIIKMIERRRVLGLADVAIPMPEDVDAAKRADVETQPRIDTGAIAVTTRVTPDSAPVLADRAMVTAPVAIAKATPDDRVPRDSGPSFLTKSERDSGPILSSPPGEALLTSPRPGPLAVARVDRSAGTPAPALAPEPQRAKRPRLADVLAKAEASGPLASAFPNDSLDDDIDVGAALARARALAGSDLDAELAALADGTAAPLAEISIEAASAELARQLGGVAVRRRERNEQAGWAPPPKTTDAEPAPKTTDAEPAPKTTDAEPARADSAEPAEHRAASNAEPVAESTAEPDIADAEFDREPVRPSLSRAGARSRRRSARDSSRDSRRRDSEPAIDTEAAHDAGDAHDARDSAHDASDAIPQPIAATPPAGLPIAPEPADTAVGAPDIIPPDISSLRGAYDSAADDAISDFGTPSHFDATATGDRIGQERPFARPVTSSREMDQLAAEAAAAIAGRDGSGVRRIERPDEAPEAAPAYANEPAPAYANDPAYAPEPAHDPAYAAPAPDHTIDAAANAESTIDADAAAEATTIAPDEMIVTPSSPRPALLIDDDADLSSFERALDAARIKTGVGIQAAPAPAIEDDDDIAELDSLDLEEISDDTEFGDVPQPAQQAELAARLDQHLDAAEAEADEEISDIRAPIERADDFHGEDVPVAAAADGADDFAEEEISDLDVVAEADAADDDLLASHGEREASGGYPAVPEDDPHAYQQPLAPQDQTPQPRADSFDFAARLDLDDDEPVSHGGMSFTDYDRKLGDLPATRSAGHELGKYDPAYDARYAGTLDDPHGSGGAGEDFDEPHQFGAHEPQRAHENFDEPHGFSTQTPAPRQRASRRSRPEADYELENALSTLDVDLDALGEHPPQGPAPGQQSPARGRPLPGMPPERASRNRLRRAPSEDDGGVLIDFDDDDEP